ncbi:MAG: HNH endonuclease [Ktedonobacteraceae bacterium]
MVDCLRCEQRFSWFALYRAWRAKCWYCDACLTAINHFVLELGEKLEKCYRSTTGVTPHRIQNFRDRQRQFRIPDAFMETFYERAERLTLLTKIRKEPLQVIRVQRILDTDEYAHYEEQAAFLKETKREEKYISGTLLLTNKRIYFIAERGNGSHKISYSNVSQVRQRSVTSLQLQVEQGVGGGIYEVVDPELVTLFIYEASRRWKGHLVSLKEQDTTQEVPEHIKVAVRQRDQGRCRMCGYADPYIEFDHIIPRSKGGPNTLNNIQLLCRGCNRKKSDKLLQ